MTEELTSRDECTDFLLYKSPEGNIKVDVFLHNETIWLTQKRMSELFDVEVNTINYHLKEIFKIKELNEKSTVRKIRIVQKEGFRDVEREHLFYNLDAIISVGYRVNSKQATQFRIWATKVLKEYMIKGFAMDDDRLKNGRYFGKDYFDELLERVRSIRASERRIYQKITDIFAECSINYDKESKITREFYATIQNKFHYAISKQTAAEIIYQKADSKKQNMGLSTWKNAPDGRILKSDAISAKNYLSEKDIKKLERTISGFFDYIERIIENRTLMNMQDLAESVNKFLEFNEFKLLKDKGNISFKQAEKKASNEYHKFNKSQKIESDFDRLTKRLTLKRDNN
ncbi:MAG: virulence RhuM family protein [archaeon]|nr:virulence RhuM family protein [archaeon]